MVNFTGNELSIIIVHMFCMSSSMKLLATCSGAERGGGNRGNHPGAVLFRARELKKNIMCVNVDVCV